MWGMLLLVFSTPVKDVVGYPNYTTMLIHIDEGRGADIISSDAFSQHAFP